MSKNSLEDTIAAISTPVGEAGICIVRLSGNKSLEIADKIFISKGKKGQSQFKTYTTHYGHIINRVSGCGVPLDFARARRATLPVTRSPLPEIIDEIILTVMRAPKSYTKEDIVEINCHGGIQAAKKVLELVTRCGARIAEPGEFTKRAFLNGRIDLAQAEAVSDVIKAKTENSLKVAMNQLEGELSDSINNIRDEIIDITSHVEAGIDFPEEELDIISEASLAKKVKNVLAKLKELILTYDKGMIFREGILAIICGKQNVGKSSLMNLLLKRDRVIVSSIPGTTRDAVEEMINLQGVPVRLVDTAGIIDTKDLLGKESVKKSKQYLALADIVLFMLDASTGIEKKDLEIIKLIKGRKKLVIINKCDLDRRLEKRDIASLFEKDNTIEISVKTRHNIGGLEKKLLEIIFGGSCGQPEGATIVSNARHKELIDKSLVNMLSVDKALKEGLPSELIAIDLKEALFNLGLIIGKSVSEDVVARIFEQFCIGK